MQPTTYMDDDVTGPRRRGRETPAKIGRFVVLGEIGAGGMGVVCAAYDPELDRKVAVKLLHPSLSGSDREDVGRARLMREAQALARLSHPNVVAVYDVGTHEGQVFIAMEFIAGVSLTAWLRERSRTVDEVRAVFLDAGRGLAAAHREGLVHGDFKPKSRGPSQTAPLPPFGRILASRGDLSREQRRVMPRHAADLATAWQRTARSCTE